MFVLNSNIKTYLLDISSISDESFNNLLTNVKQYRRDKISSLTLKSSKFLSLAVELLIKKACLDFDIDYEKLFFNMLKADADYLYTLQEWENVLTVDKMKEIVKDYNRSKIVHVEKKPGRNEPCPCGSGKKYKNCCGKNA